MNPSIHNSVRWLTHITVKDISSLTASYFAAFLVFALLMILLFLATGQDLDSNSSAYGIWKEIPSSTAIIFCFATLILGLRGRRIAFQIPNFSTPLTLLIISYFSLISLASFVDSQIVRSAFISFFIIFPGYVTELIRTGERNYRELLEGSDAIINTAEQGAAANP